MLDYSMRLVRALVREYLDHGLDPRQGHSSATVGHDFFQDYVVWARTNGYDYRDTKNLDEYAITRELDIPTHEIEGIRRRLGITHHT
jgi:hypothetical protein